ncbi:NAD/NADP octopine/nopaline dehydrogenase family protein [Virgibacillus sp. W0181]|uniref:NAD/NADP octopine/nopaline dehydrogenase family protein n=1 Tax=Virgibacillus sp. W0181 TaxID=3391581 RepID=UPI003F459054
MQKSKNLRWGVIGGGNGGQAVSGYLGTKYSSVRLYDIKPETINTINKQGGVQLSGIVNELGKVEATSRIEDVVTNSDIILVILPAYAHKQIAKQCIPFLRDGQTIVLLPGSTGGTLDFYNEFKKSSMNKDVKLAETQSLIYSCDSSRSGHVQIFGIKDKLLLSALPSMDTDYIVNIMNDVYPQIIPAENVLETSLSNGNAIVHPIPTLLNVCRIDGKVPYLFYMDGVTPAIGELTDKIDQERLKVGEKLGLSLESNIEMLKTFYKIEGNNSYELIMNNYAYEEIDGPQDINHKFFLEDIPMGLVPMASLGKKIGVETPIMDAVIQLTSSLLDKNFIKEGRTLENLGLGSLSIEEILNFVNKG